METTQRAQGRYRLASTAHTRASITTVWDMIADISSWAQWGPWDVTERIQDGATERDGVGAVRSLRRGRTVSIEEVVEFDPPRHLSYRLRSGLPLRGYRADVVLTEGANGGTVITWRSSFDGAPFGTAHLLRLMLQRFLAMVTTALADAAERRPV